MSAVTGKNLIYLYRLESEKATEDGTRIAFTTEDELSISADADATATKDGSVRGASVAELEKTCTSLMSADDPMLPKLKSAILNGSLVELWEVNLDKPIANQTNKYAGTYYQAYLSEFTISSPADGNVQVSMTFGINGKGADGNVTVTASQQDDEQYTFVDTPKTGA
jgi:TP901-1 family phage major tail protein